MELSYDRTSNVDPTSTRDLNGSSRSLAPAGMSTGDNFVKERQQLVNAVERPSTSDPPPQASAVGSERVDTSNADSFALRCTLRSMRLETARSPPMK